MAKFQVWVNARVELDIEASSMTEAERIAEDSWYEALQFVANLKWRIFTNTKIKLEEWIDMNLLEKICKELGVEISKKWLGSDGFYYYIGNSGQIEVLNKDDELLNYGYIYWEDIFTGLLKPAWRPKERDAYYIPNINARMENIRYNVRYWNNDECDKFYLANGMVFKTIQEAIEATNKMLEVIK